jgi:ABC-type polysaccharide transport system permease subunit
MFVEINKPPAPVNNRGKSFQKIFRKNWELYLILLVPIIWLILFHYAPMYGSIIAFKRFRARDGILASPWAADYGLANFIKFFKSPIAGQVIRNTVTLSLYGIIAGFPMPVLLALALNACMGRKFKKTVQYFSYMPFFISTVVMIGILNRMLHPTIGVLGRVLTQANSSGILVPLLGRADLFSTIYVWSGIWQNNGWNSVIYIAALSAIDPELHEAAMIDGASRFKRILYIDIPGILPTMIILLILNTGQIMSVGFEKVFLLQNSLNMSTSRIISTYVYEVGLRSEAADFSYGAAIGLFNSVVNLFIISIVNKISQNVSETSLW